MGGGLLISLFFFFPLKKKKKCKQGEGRKGFVEKSEKMKTEVRAEAKNGKGKERWMGAAGEMTNGCSPADTPVISHEC